MNLKDQLLEVAKTKRLCTVFEYDDLEDGYTGVVLNVTEEELLLKRVNRDGRENGYFLMKTEDIVCYCTGDREMKRRWQLWEEKEYSRMPLVKGENLMDELLGYALEEMEPVGVCCQGYMYTGWLKGFSDEMVVLTEFTYCGEDDGEVWLRRDCIDTVEVDSQELRIPKNMWKGRMPEIQQKSEEGFFERLKAYEGKNWLFQFYLDGDLRTCYVGELECVTEKEFMVRHMNSEGQYDGLAVFPLSRMACVYEKSRYLSKMKKIMSEEWKRKGADFLFKGKFLSNRLMRYAQRKGQFMMLQVEKQEYLGKIIEWDRNQIYLAVYDWYGRKNGEMRILREWVKAIWIDNVGLRKIKKCQKGLDGNF